MAYCTNCGKETTKNICEHCGVKNNKTHKFCFWCGEAINENASICINCKESIKPNKALKVIGIILSVPCFILSLLFAVVILSDSTNLSDLALALWLIVSGILLINMSNIHQKLKEKTYESLNYKESSTRIISIVCSILITFAGILGTFFICGAITVSAPSTESKEVVEEKIGVDETDENAAKAAKIILQQDLKNPYSLQVHNSWVSYKYAIDDENYYDVTLDYSAENGFGGMNRESITLEIRYNTTERMYYYSYVKIILD